MESQSERSNRPSLDRQKDNRSGFTEQFRLDQETLNILAGRRVAQRRQAAIRIEDMLSVLQMPQNIQALKVTNAAGVPTNAEYNALVAQYNKMLLDVGRLHEVLRVVSNALRLRLAGEK